MESQKKTSPDHGQKISQNRAKKEFHHISAVKEGKGSLLLERNDFGKVYYHSAKKKLILKLTTGTGFSYEIFPVEQYEEANEKAKRAEEQGKQSGKELGITNPEEDTARMLWRRFVQEQTEHGLEVKSLVDVVLEAIENERRKDTTPLFSEVAFQFLEHKETLACWCEEWRSKITKRILLLSKAPSLAGKTLSEVSARNVEAAIRECVYSRRCKNSDISKNTLIQWQKLIKEIFKWWFDNSNGEKPHSLQLKNPLARYEVGTFRNMEEPELISVSNVKTLLWDLWVHEKFAIPLVATQIFCGVRNREAAKIQWKDFKNDCTILYLPKAKTKNKIARNVPVPPCLTSWLKAYCLSSGVPDPNSFLTASKAGGKKGRNTPE